ncbi:hypothetical protein ACQKMI_10795 [Lysinibacillus sp. NPDC097214]|uniref:hypothetical protein n=1 Tax=Lysinibacillus sp. NPDC097214 TaxID=3390584 RepID=UPI003D03D895
MFFIKRKFIKSDIKYMAELLYQDVSPEKWDQENLTKDNLNFSIESVRLVDDYADRLMHTEFGQQLLKEHPDNFPVRIGVYLGEVIKNFTNGQFNWFEFNSIQENTIHLNNYLMSVEDESVLYSKKLDKVICPIYETIQYLNGKSKYKTLLNYVDEVIKIQ